MKNNVIIENFCTRERCLDKFLNNALRTKSQAWYSSKYSLLSKFYFSFIFRKSSEGKKFWDSIGNKFIKYLKIGEKSSNYTELL